MEWKRKCLLSTYQGFSSAPSHWNGVVPSSDRIFCSGEHRFFKTRNWESFKNNLRLIRHSYIHPFSTSKKESESWFSTNLNRPALALKLVCYRCWIYCRIPVNGREGGRGLAERIRTDNRHLHFKGREGAGRGKQVRSTFHASLLLGLYVPSESLHEAFSPDISEERGDH